jgi:hypothetical protein
VSASMQAAEPLSSPGDDAASEFNGVALAVVITVIAIALALRASDNLDLNIWSAVLSGSLAVALARKPNGSAFYRTLVVCGLMSLFVIISATRIPVAPPPVFQGLEIQNDEAKPPRPSGNN